MPVQWENLDFFSHACCISDVFYVKESADDLVKLYKRVSLDDDLDDQLRSELLSQLSAGASSTLRTLKLVICARSL